MLDNGQHPRLGVEPIRETKLETLREFTDHMEMATNEAHSALQRAADDMSRFYDVHRQHAFYDCNTKSTLVLLLLR